MKSIAVIFPEVEEIVNVLFSVKVTYAPEGIFPTHETETPLFVSYIVPLPLKSLFSNVTVELPPPPSVLLKIA